MSIVMFAIIGAILDLGTAYWICFGVHCASWLYQWIFRFRVADYID